MATEKKQKLESIEGLDPLSRYRRIAFIAGSKGDDVWREQQTIYANAVHDKIISDADFLMDSWRSARMSNAAAKAAKKAQILRAKADKIEAEARAVAE
jgi:hypothetical protein